MDAQTEYAYFFKSSKDKRLSLCCYLCNVLFNDQEMQNFDLVLAFSWSYKNDLNYEVKN